ncbi:hypothetical protein LXL04_006301 [Taraxacum kok-saghyz]
MREEWREVRRRHTAPKNFTGDRNDPNITSFYISNLPGDATKSEIWRPCSRLGRLVDVYIAGRRDANGVFFAFVRFERVANHDKLEEELNNLACRGRKLTANLAKHPRKPAAQMPSRSAVVAPLARGFPPAARGPCSFADVAKGKSASVSAAPVVLTCISEIVDWSKEATIIGEAKDFDTLCNFPSLIALEGYDVAECKYLGGMQVVIKFKSPGDAEVFKANKCVWLKWFVWVEHLGKKSTSFERIAWLKITGVPIHAWDDANFAAIAGIYGKVLVNFNSFWSCKDVSYGKICLLTGSRKRLNEEILVLVNGVSIKIGIFEVEDDWAPFKPFITGSTSGSEGDHDDDNDEWVSDTWKPEKMEMEEGEIDEDDGFFAGNPPVSEPVRNGQSVTACEEGHRNSPTRVSATIDTCSNSNDGTNDLSAPVNDKPDPVQDTRPTKVNPRSRPSSIGLPRSPSGQAETISSPEFDQGESTIKRRRIKKKIFGGPPHSISFPVSQLPNKNVSANTSIDLNRQTADSQSQPRHEATRVSSSQSSSIGSSQEVVRTAQIGAQVGFQIDPGNLAFLDAVNGGGDKIGSL